MRHALSTRCLLNHRLNTLWLSRIWEAGIPNVELFCARQHLDYRDSGQTSELGHWFRDSQLKVHALHAPIHNDTVSGRTGPSSLLAITETVKAKRIQVVDELKRAIELIEDIPCRYVVLQFGVEQDEFDERKMDAAFTSLEELLLFTRQRGGEILLKNAVSGLASAERLEYFNSVTHLNVNYCFDFGHAHRMPDEATEFETMKRRIRSVHAHDNNGVEDLRLPPRADSAVAKAGGGGIDWRKAMSRLRKSIPSSTLVLEFRDLAEMTAPIEEARRSFDWLESIDE